MSHKWKGKRGPNSWRVNTCGWVLQLVLYGATWVRFWTRLVWGMLGKDLNPHQLIAMLFLCQAWIEMRHRNDMNNWKHTVSLDIRDVILNTNINVHLNLKLSVPHSPNKTLLDPINVFKMGKHFKQHTTTNYTSVMPLTATGTDCRWINWEQADILC